MRSDGGLCKGGRLVMVMERNNSKIIIIINSKLKGFMALLLAHS